MASINIYLNFNGTTEEAFNFYKSILGGEFVNVTRFKDSPGCENMPSVDQDKIMHVALPFGNSFLMGTDIPESMAKAVNGTSISISIDTDSEEEAKRIFDGLSEGGAIQIPLEKMFWNALYGMFTDKFGIQWMVNYNYEPCV